MKKTSLFISMAMISGLISFASCDGPYIAIDPVRPVSPSVSPSVENKNTITFTTTGQGNNSCIPEAREVIKDPAVRKTFWDKHTACMTNYGSAIPSLNFDGEMEIAIVIPSYNPDSELTIQKVTEETDSLTVNAELKQGTNLNKIDNIYHLYHFIKLKKSDKIVKFNITPASPQFIIPANTPTPKPYFYMPSANIRRNGSVPYILPTPSNNPISYPGFENIDKGQYSYIKEYTEVVIYTKEEFDDLWLKHRGDGNVPVVDFDRYNVVGIFLGPVNNANVYISQIAKHSANDYNNKEDTIYVHADQETNNNIISTELNYPYHLVKVEKFNETSVKFDVYKKN